MSTAPCNMWLVNLLSFFTNTDDLVTPEYSVRLVGSESELSGRLEILRSGVWGTVCNNNFNQAAAEVVCRQLNVTNPSSVLIILNTGPVYGVGSGVIWIDNVMCNGMETNLNECSHSEWGQPDSAQCIHSADVSISCEGAYTPFLHIAVCFIYIPFVHLSMYVFPDLPHTSCVM